MKEVATQGEQYNLTLESIEYDSQLQNSEIQIPNRLKSKRKLKAKRRSWRGVKEKIQNQKICFKCGNKEYRVAERSLELSVELKVLDNQVYGICNKELAFDSEKIVFSENGYEVTDSYEKEAILETEVKSQFHKFTKVEIGKILAAVPQNSFETHHIEYSDSFERDDEFTVPLCEACHKEVHSMNEESYLTPLKNLESLHAINGANEDE